MPHSDISGGFYQKGNGFMTKGQKKRLYRIIFSAVLLLAAVLIPQKTVRILFFVASYLLVGWDVIYKSFRGIAHGQVFDENFLMLLATIGAFAIGEYAEGVFVMLFYQVGELFQDMAVARSRQSISQLMDIRPDYVNIRQEGELVQVDPDELSVGDVFYVKPGEKVPLDGRILEGASSLDMMALTGESVPQEVEAGAEILSGSVNLSGLLCVEATKEFGESTVAKILEMVEEASDKKSRSENFITRFARYYTPVVVVLAVLLAVVPMLVVPGAEWQEWLSRALVFLVISCPCALVISVPLSFFGGLGGASKAGILIKGGNYLEALAQTEIAVFDKTGTLTEGSFTVQQVESAGRITEEELLEKIALAECYSPHPISLSLKKAYGKEPDESRVSGVEELSGRGVSACVDGKRLYVGNARLMEERGIQAPAPAHAGTVVYAADDQGYLGMVRISDQVKEDAAFCIETLKKARVKTVMLTGDRPEAAQEVARELGVDQLYAGLLPGDKVEKMEELLSLRSKNGKVVFMGDGINDAPVLTRADIGVAMGGVGSDAAIEAADVVIMNDQPSKLGTAIQISRRTLRIVKQNIVFALGIKVLFLILGAFGIANIWMGIFADVGVAVLAILNAMRCLKAIQ